MTGAPWLTRALADLGQAEIAGSADNPNIMAAFKACGHPEIEHETTAWCAAKIGHWLTDAGQTIPPRSINLMARSYLTYGVPCEPKPGAIAVWPRGAPPSGHVNMVVAVLPDGRIRCIDGNLGDKVQFSVRDPGGALAFRWPVAPTVSSLGGAGSKDIAAAVAIRRVAKATGALAAGTAATVPQAPPQLPAVLPPPEALQTAAEQAGYVSTIAGHLSSAISTVGNLVIAHPWLIPAAGLCGGLWYFSSSIIQTRLARALQGAPLSQEV